MNELPKKKRPSEFSPIWLPAILLALSFCAGLIINFTRPDYLITIADLRAYFLTVYFPFMAFCAIHCRILGVLRGTFKRVGVSFILIIVAICIVNVIGGLNSLVSFLLPVVVLVAAFYRSSDLPQPPRPIILTAIYLFLSASHFFLNLGNFAIQNFIDRLGPAAAFLIPSGVFFLFIMVFRFIPWHRRMWKRFWPSRLPHLNSRPRGVTLIDLLIVIAIVAICALGITQSTMTVHRIIERQEDWRRAVDLADDEIALLRSRNALPDLGTHPLEPELAAKSYLAKRGEIEIRPGPAESLREVRVTIKVGGDGGEKIVTLAAILPIHPIASGEGSLR